MILIAWGGGDIWNGADSPHCLCCGVETAHLRVIVAKMFGDSTLTIHQKGVPAPLLGQGCLVTFSHKPIQLALFGTHDLHVLGQGAKTSKTFMKKMRTCCPNLRPNLFAVRPRIVYRIQSQKHISPISYTCTTILQ